MRSCSRHTHMKMLKGIGYSDNNDTPLLCRTWFIITLIVLDIALMIIQAVALT